MALYFYQAFSKDGKKVTGYVDASTAQGAREQLSKQGLYPISITTSASQEVQGSWWQRIFSRSVPEKQKILFTKQLAILLKSGVPLLQALELLVDQFEGKLHSILIKIRDDIKEGQSLADALKKYPKVFENIYVQLVRAGEASGKLEVILQRLTTFMERREVQRKKIRSALQMPIIQLVVAVLVVTALLTYVVPQMAENFAGMGKELPGVTQFLISISNFITGHYLIILIVLAGMGVGIKYWMGTPAGARAIDNLKLRLPLIKYYSRTNAVVQFSSTLGMLIESGVNLAESLDIVVSIINNRILADTLREARDKIIKQGKISQYLEQTKIFPPIAIYLIRTGEETGQLDFMLLTVAQNYEEELSELTDRLTAVLGPLLLLVMAVVVGFIVIAIALPMVQMGEVAGLT